VIDSPRLRLRPWTAGDLDAFAALVGDPAVMEHSLSGPLDRAAAGLRLAAVAHAQARHGYSAWAAELLEDGTVVGMIGLSHPWFLPGYEHEVEIGWRLAPSHRGLGLATEGARAALDWGLEHLDVERIVALVEPSNAPSLRLAARLGMKEDGRTSLSGRQILVRSVRRRAYGAT
jgi:RimJ/RimL family protein N-acetyltransferase